MNRNRPDVIRHWIDEQDGIDISFGMTNAKVYAYPKMILKIEETHEESNNEYRMLQWLQGRLPVPRLIAFAQQDNYNFLLMERLDGYMVFEEPIMNDIETMISLLASGLKHLWKVDISDCPYHNTISNKLRLAQERLDNNLIDMDDVNPSLFTSGRFSSMQDILSYLIDHSPVEDLVMSHGDYCLPNLIVTPNEIVGFIDLGRAGVADRWQDIALCIRSMRYNLGSLFQPKHIDMLMRELDIEYDPFKADYYVLLDEFF